MGILNFILFMLIAAGCIMLIALAIHYRKVSKQRELTDTRRDRIYNRYDRKGKPIRNQDREDQPFEF